MKILLKRSTHISRFCYTTQRIIPKKTIDHFTKIYPQTPYSWLPLRFTDQTPKAPGFWSLLTGRPRVLSEVYDTLISFLQDPCPDNSIFIQPNLANRYRQQLRSNKATIKVLQNKLLCCNLYDTTEVAGVFIHRDLNLKNQCYSFEEVDNCEKITYRVKKQLGRSSDLAEQTKIQKRYKDENWDRVYIQHYNRFVEKDYIIRDIYLVDASIELEVKTPKETIVLGKDIITRHYLQLQRIYFPYGIGNFYIADVDFYLKGNPYTQQG